MGLREFFEPESIAVIGASREENKPGHVIFRLLKENRDKGTLKAKVYPVNPKAKELLGEPCYPSIGDIPDKVSLAVIVVPAPIVPKVIEDCGKKGVKSAIVISAGFSEVGNRKLEEELLTKARKYGIRILGPNCIGVLNPWTGVDTIFLPYFKVLKNGRKLLSTPRPKPGHIAFLSQSGAFATAAMDYMAGEKLGLRALVSYGNKADVDEADLIEYFGSDEKTRAILMYIESLERGRKVIEVASKVMLRKPIVALKAGRTKAGVRAAASHTAALAGVDEIYEAAFRKAGIIRAYDMEQLFDLAKALSMQPPAKGGRVAIVTDGGGAGVMTTDECELNGLIVPELTGEDREKLEKLREEKIIPRFASLRNPIDLTGSATTEMYVESIKILMESENIDLIIVLALHQVPGIEDPIELAEQVVKIQREYNFSKPIVAVDTGWSEAAVCTRETFDEGLIPSYSTPERAARVAAALYRYGNYLRKKGELENYLKRWHPAI